MIYLYDHNHFSFMFRQLLAITILLALLFQTFNRLIIVADYYTNTAAYAKNCINKAKPKMRCNGNCQMMKKLEEEEKKDQQNTERKADNKNEVISSRSFYPTISTVILVKNISSYFIIDDNARSSMPHTFFHPPGMA